MFKGQKRQTDARHFAHFPGPQTRGIDHVFRPDATLIRNDLPATVCLRFQCLHPGVPVDGGALLFRRLGVAMGNHVGVDMTLINHEDTAFQTCYVDDGTEIAYFPRGDELRFNSHELVPRGLVLQKIPPGIGSSQIDAAGQVHTYRCAGDLFDFVVEIDGVFLQPGNIRVAIQGMKTTGGMPGGTGCQFLAFQQDYVRPPKPGKVVQDTATNHAAADNNNPCMCLHACPSYVCIRIRRILQRHAGKIVKSFCFFGG